MKIPFVLNCIIHRWQVDNKDGYNSDNQDQRDREDEGNIEGYTCSSDWLMLM
jgi:hypothetical protein